VNTSGFDAPTPIAILRADGAVDARVLAAVVDSELLLGYKTWTASSTMPEYPAFDFNQVYFVTSDTLFSHARIIEVVDRPFNSVEEMDAELARRSNETVAPDDIVLHLGDLALGPIPGSLPLTAQLRAPLHRSWQPGPRVARDMEQARHRQVHAAVRGGGVERPSRGCIRHARGEQPARFALPLLGRHPRRRSPPCSHLVNRGLRSCTGTPMTARTDLLGINSMSAWMRLGSRRSP
jgi:hypothetical protein